MGGFHLQLLLLVLPCLVTAQVNQLQRPMADILVGFNPSASGPNIDGPASSAQIGRAYGLAYIEDEGDNFLYFSDEEHHTIRVLQLDTGVVRTIAGTPQSTGFADGDGSQSSFSSPRGIALRIGDDNDDLFICDTLNNAIRVVDVEDGEEVLNSLGHNVKVETVFEDGTSSAAVFLQPTSIAAYEPDNTFYIGGTDFIYTINFEEPYNPTVVAGFTSTADPIQDGVGTNAEFGFIESLHVYNGNMVWMMKYYIGYSNALIIDSLQYDSPVEQTVPRGLLAAGGGQRNDTLKRVVVSNGFAVDTVLGGGNPVVAVTDPARVGGTIETARFAMPQDLEVDFNNQVVYMATVGGIFELSENLLTQSPSTSVLTYSPTQAPLTQAPLTQAPLTQSPSTLTPTTPSPIENLAQLSISNTNTLLHESFPPWAADRDVSGQGVSTITLTNDLLGNPDLTIRCVSSDTSMVVIDPADGAAFLTGSGESAEYTLHSVYSPVHEERTGLIDCSIVEEATGQSVSIPFSVTVRDVIWPLIADWAIRFEGSLLSSVTETAGDGRVEYSVTLNGATEVVALIQDPFLLGADFSGNSSGSSSGGGSTTNCPMVTIGSLQAEVLSCSASNVTFLSPSYSSLCGDDEECGYQPVRISFPNGLIRGGQPDEAIGGSIACPGECPLSGLGFFYTPECSETMRFTSSVQCARIEEYPDGCAFGVGDGCRPCDSNAYCPGGNRMWPREGYWTASEEIGSVSRCGAPSTTRCRGWDISGSEADCGSGYEGVLCSSCQDGFFEQLGECFACPESSLEGGLPLAVLIGLAATIFISVYTCLRCSELGRSGEEYRDLITWQAKDFAIWTVLVLQLFALVTTTASANAPAATVVLAWINVASFDFQAVGPECFSDNNEAFLREYVILGASLLALILAFVLSGKGPFGKLEMAKNFRGNVFVFLIAVYTPATLLGAGASYCIGSNGELVSWANPNIECAGPVHLPVMVLGLVVLCFHSLFFPIWSLLKIRSVYNSTRREEKLLQRHYRKFFGDDYLPNRYWVRAHHLRPSQVLQCQMLLAFFLCMTRVYLSRNGIKEQVLVRCEKLHSKRRESLNLYESDDMQQSKVSLTADCEACAELNGYDDIWRTSGFSYVVFLVALVNFVVLGYCFWFVVFRKKDAGYYAMHFMMQRKGGLTDSGHTSTHPTAKNEGFSKIVLSTNPSGRNSISDSNATARLTKAASPRAIFPRQSRPNRFNEIRSMEDPVLEDIKRVTRNNNSYSPTGSLRNAGSGGQLQNSMSSNDSPLSTTKENPANLMGRERAQTQAID
eukprot:jgi/Bigna1/66937/fgenesh1_pg.2_\